MTRPTRIEVCCGGCDENGTKPKCGKCGVQVEVELTDAEIAQMETDRISYATRKAEEDAAKEALEALKVSARNKLIAGQPLTAEEAATIVF